MISYYELLGMVKEGKAPNKIRVHLNSQPREYKMIFDCGECNYYELIGNENNDYKYYLSDSYLESMMFDETIEILGEKKMPEKEKIYKIEDDLPYESLIVWQRANNKIFEKQINEIIDYLNNKGE